MKNLFGQFDKLLGFDSNPKCYLNFQNLMHFSDTKHVLKIDKFYFHMYCKT